jgi:DNA processing protein
MYPSNILVLLHLSLIVELGPAATVRLLQFVCTGKQKKMLAPTLAELCSSSNTISFAGVYDLTLQDVVRVTGLKQENAQAVVDGLKNKTMLDQELDLIATHGVALLTPFDVYYPEILKQIHHPPVVLYAQGDLAVLTTKSVAIVGARKATSYAQKVIDVLVPPLVQQGWTISSGGALGADAMAHKATLDVGGKTVAVLGSGLLEIYPLQNSALFRRIVECGGVMLSPFPLRRTPDKNTFPMRNRIIAGISMGTLVVQAAKQSGALITARFALEQGRSVLAVPGEFNSELSAGCHGLLKQGARLVTSVDDIFEEFGEEAGQQSLLTPPAAEQDLLLATLQQPATLDELLTRTNVGLEALQDRLFVLQLEGKIKQHFSGTWQQI